MIDRLSLKIAAVDLAASVALVALETAGRILDRRKPTPAPLIADMPRQRVRRIESLIELTPHEMGLLRQAGDHFLDSQMPPMEVLLFLADLHYRSVPMVKGAKVDHWALWLLEMQEQA